LRIQYGCPAPTFCGVLVDKFSFYHIVVETDLMGQPPVHERVVLAAKFLVPRLIVGVPLEDLL